MKEPTASTIEEALGFFSRAFASATREVSIPSLTGSADAFLALALANSSIRRFVDSSIPEGTVPKVILVTTPGIPEAERIADDLRTISARLPHRIFEFPPLLADDRSALGTRLKTISALRAWNIAPYPAVIVAPSAALSTPIPTGTVPELVLSAECGVQSVRGTVRPEFIDLSNRRFVESSNLQVNKSTNRRIDKSGSVPISFTDICTKLQEMGYNRVAVVEQEGDYSVRGGIVDAWSPGEEFPIRAEFFGEDLESLRAFNAATQTSVERLSSATLIPVSEPGAQCSVPGAQCLVPSAAETIFDILPEDSTVLALEHNAYTLPALRTQHSALSTVYTGDPAPAGVPSLAFQTAPLPGFAELGAGEAHHPELFDAARARLDRHLETAEKRGDLVLHLDDLSAGFELVNSSIRRFVDSSNQEFENSTIQQIDESINRRIDKFPGTLLVVTKADRVFTKRKTRGSRRNSNFGRRIDDFDELEPGEYVVHIDYGVGRFIGSSEIHVDGKRSEVFTIEYADGAKLHVPADHAHLLSRYVGVKGEAVRLHRLDGKKWTKDKLDAERAVADLAANLLRTQARREIVPGFAYDVECDGLDAFEAAFPYEETPDQLAAIAAIKKDLAGTKPMDRLICGDAGYGKTEVAMRAAFIAAMNGKQVAVLAPTTVLAEQHFETFTSRFDGTPVRIEAVSRFQSTGTHAGTFQRLATGVCDIVIGTHAILSPKVAFHDLGLIIVDEEQRFGVRHKEFLKALRATADVLTLSATPIPRTLYLSMTGARDLSLLRSPPRERTAVDLKVVRESDEVIGAAIEAEIARGGQIYFLHNRVTTISKIEKRLKEIVPACRIVVAHGQMDSRTLARKMRDFERGDYDLLLATTIIESGIDIPRANTIIVHEADKFGLADLYQLRGRVGRSAKQGRAILLLPPSGSVDSDARERLAALQRHGGLGGGFNLAMRDLELRGAGNLLGAQQSGHIATIGFTLYCQLLQRTIARMKGEKPKEIIDVKLNLDFVELSPTPENEDIAASLPYAYVEEDALRMSFMKRLAEAGDVRVVNALAAELEDRFGKMPKPVKRLIALAKLKVKCAAAEIDRIDVKGSRAVFYRVGSRDIAYVEDLKASSCDTKIAALTKLVR